MLAKLKLWQKLSLVAAIGLAGLIILFIFTSLWIERSVQEKCQFAQQAYQQDDCRLAVSQLLQDETASFHNRNDAIWTLGQLDDDRALLVLRSFYTGQVPDRELYNDTLSQYELHKAIQLLENGINLTKVVRKF